MPYDPKIHHRKSIRLKGFDYSRPGYYFVTFATHDLKPIFGEIINGELRLNSIGMIAWQEWVRMAHLRKGIVLDEFIIMPNHIHAIIKIEGDAGIDALQSGRARLAAGAKKRAMELNSRKANREGNFRATQSVARTGEAMPRPDSAQASACSEPMARPNSSRACSSSPSEPQARPLPKGPKAGSIGAIIAVYKSIVSRKIKNRENSQEAVIWHRNFHEAVIRDSAELEARRNYIRNNPGKWGKDKYQK